jgi:hypothetical protein
MAGLLLTDKETLIKSFDAWRRYEFSPVFRRPGKVNNGNNLIPALKSRAKFMPTLRAEDLWGAS